MNGNLRRYALDIARALLTLTWPTSGTCLKSYLLYFPPRQAGLVTPDSMELSSTTHTRTRWRVSSARRTIEWTGTAVRVRIVFVCRSRSIEMSGEVWETSMLLVFDFWLTK